MFHTQRKNMIAFCPRKVQILNLPVMSGKNVILVKLIKRNDV